MFTFQVQYPPLVSRLFFLLCLSITLSLGLSDTALAQTSPDSLTYRIPDTLLFKLQKAQAVVTAINASNRKGYGISRASTGFADVKNNLAPIQQELRVPQKIIDSKDLASYNVILKDAQQKLNTWQKNLTRSSNELQRHMDQVIELSNDSLLSINEQDSTVRRLYTAQVTDLKLRLQQSGKDATAKLDTVSQLLASISATNLTVTDLLVAIDERLKTSTTYAFSQETPYLWSAPNAGEADDLETFLRSSYRGQKKILSYFLSSDWDSRLLLVALVVAFFVWVNRNFKKARLLHLQEKMEEVKYDSIRPLPILAACILWFNTIPLFESDSPSLYVELTQFFLLVAVTIHTWKRISRSDLQHWLIILGMYVILVVTNLLVHSALYMRLVLIALNIGFLYMGVSSYSKLKLARFGEHLIRPVGILYMALNSLAIVLNIFGRITLAKVLSITAVIGLTQLVGLAFFVQILTDALDLQMKVSACSEGLFSRVNTSRTRTAFRKVLTFLAIVLWVLVFVINLNLFNQLYALTLQVLSKPRTFGSVSFTLGSIALFVVIVYVSNFLQKHIGVLFGESSVTFTDQSPRRSSQLVLIRLIIAIAGVLLAVSASGIPSDKLTVILGALGVGIGLGMQNIVNNFVSGIILIFEKPFQIGDYVELADKKGKVKDIGIRSSKMLTPQGSEVIIPNGDLLSGRLVNWTASSAYLKSEITLKISIEADMDQVQKMITDEIKKLKDAVKNIPPEIYVNGIAADSIELKILLWVSSIYTEANCKSQLYRQLLKRFKDAEIKVM